MQLDTQTNNHHLASILEDKVKTLSDHLDKALNAKTKTETCLSEQRLKEQQLAATMLEQTQKVTAAESKACFLEE